MYDDSLQPVPGGFAVAPESVLVKNGGLQYAACVDWLLASVNFLKLVNQQCGPTMLEFSAQQHCPQVLLPNDHFAQIFVPIAVGPEVLSVEVCFDLLLLDERGQNASLSVCMTLATADFATWPNAAQGSIDLARLVVPRLLVGSEHASQGRRGSTPRARA